MLHLALHPAMSQLGALAVAAQVAVRRWVAPHILVGLPTAVQMALVVVLELALRSNLAVVLAAICAAVGVLQLAVPVLAVLVGLALVFAVAHAAVKLVQGLLVLQELLAPPGLAAEVPPSPRRQPLLLPAARD